MKPRTFQQVSFCANQWWSWYKFVNKFQDDISYALAMFSYMWDWLFLSTRNWFFATNSDLKWVSLQPNIVNLKYFKPWIIFIIHVQIIEVCNIKGLHHQVAKIKELENLSLWQFLWFLFCILDLDRFSWQTFFRLKSILCG